MRIVIALVIVAALAGCGSARQGPSSAARSSSSVAAPVPSCLQDLRPTGFQTSTGVSGELVGSARRAIVLSNESDADLCGWLPFATQLRDAGYAVALFDYTADPRADLRSVIGYLRGHGRTDVTLMGASEGAKASIIEGASLRPAVTAVVSLSAEADLQGTAVAPYAAKLTAPTLFVTAQFDAYGAAAAARGFHAHCPAKVNQLVTVTGSAHGVQLLSSRAAPQILTFLHRY